MSDTGTSEKATPAARSGGTNQNGQRARDAGALAQARALSIPIVGAISAGAGRGGKSGGNDG
ncbi:MAG: hypothetical protein JST16_15275 [Bdellovibrionales bacterium]|nr:hypothetical protein [Bdellovibrionales bacterium]